MAEAASHLLTQISSTLKFWKWGDESYHRAPYPTFELTPLSLGDDAELELAMHLSELGYDYQIL
jgi:hypothetical protein